MLIAANSDNSVPSATPQEMGKVYQKAHLNMRAPTFRCWAGMLLSPAACVTGPALCAKDYLIRIARTVI